MTGVRHLMRRRKLNQPYGKLAREEFRRAASITVVPSNDGA